MLRRRANGKRDQALTKSALAMAGEVLSAIIIVAGGACLTGFASLL